MSILTQQRQALAGLVLFTPEINIWGGTVNFDPRDQLSENARQEMPPHQLATNGQLQLIPAGNKRQVGGSASPLAPLTSIRKAVQRRLRAAGFAFLGSTAVPQSDADELLLQLQHLESEFDAARETLLSNLPGLYVQQQAAFPSWVSMLNAHQPRDVAQLRKRFGFLIHVHGIATPDGQNAAAHCDATASTVLPALLAEVARSAEEILRESFRGRSEVTQKAVNPIRSLIDKLDAFSFVDSQVAPLVGVLRNQMQAIPSTGPLISSQVNAVMATLGLMAKPDHLLAYGALHHASATQVFADATVPATIVQQAPEALQLALVTEPASPPENIAPALRQPQPEPLRFSVGF